MAIYKLGDIVEKCETIKDKTKDRLYIDLSSIKTNDYKKIIADKYPSRAKWKIDGEAILIGRVRPKNRSHGLINKKDFVASSGFTAFTTKTDLISMKYLWYILNTDEFIRYTVNKGKGSTYPEISNKDLFNYSIEVPTIEEQNSIIDIIEPIERLINKIRLLKNILTKAKDAYIASINQQIELTGIATIKRFSKLINSSNLSPNGSYFYSTGKILSQKKKTDSWNFEDGLSIPYEGAGMLLKNDRYFMTYHPGRVYLGRKYGIKTNYPFSVYYSIHNKIDGSMSKSLGLKMPKLTLEMIRNLPVIKTTEEIETNLKLIFETFSKIDSVEEKSISYIEKILRMKLK